MNSPSDLKIPKYKILSNEEIMRANAILYDYFRNSRYPKRIEKLKLAEKAGVSLQFVINFFYNTRSRIQNLEKRQAYINAEQRNTYLKNNINNHSGYSKIYEENLDFHSENKYLNGGNNNLYKSLPIISPSLLNLSSDSLNTELFSKIKVFDELNFENINNLN